MGRVRAGNGMFISISAFLALFAKQASKVTKKFKNESNSPRLSLKASLASSKQLLSPYWGEKKKSMGKNKKENPYEEEDGFDGFGDGGLWQRGILMGEKCQPPDFSGVIYYDHNGNQLSELPPRSPRVSPLPGYAFGRTAEVGY